MTKIEKCRMALFRADHFLKAAQGYAPKRGTNRAQIERRIVHIREKLSELSVLLKSRDEKGQKHDHADH